MPRARKSIILRRSLDFLLMSLGEVASVRVDRQLSLRAVSEIQCCVHDLQRSGYYGKCIRMITGTTVC